MLLVYYVILGAFFAFGAEFYGDYSQNITTQLNASSLGSSEIDTGGLFSSGVSFTRFVFLLLLGIGLPSGTPAWFMVLFFLWQTMITIFSIGFIISSIWNG